MKRILIGLLAFLSTLAFANNEEHAVSTQTGANIYLVVTEGKGPSKRELGFYTRQDSDWIPAVLGNISLHPQTGPILNQFKISEIDRRSMSAALINGYLTLFSLDSRPNLSKSMAQIGGLEHPVLHPLTQTPVHILPIHEAKDIALFEYQEKKSTRSALLFGSIRLKDKFGITFCVKIGPVENGRISLLSDVVLLSQEFNDESALSKIAQLAVGDKIWVPEVDAYVRSVLQRELKGSYASLMKEWSAGIASQFATHGYYFDLESKQITSQFPPYFFLSAPVATSFGDYRPVQVIDPISHRRYIVTHSQHIDSTSNPGDASFVNGTIGLDAKGEPLYRMAGSEFGTIFEIAMIDNVVKLLVSPRKAADHPYNLSTDPIADLSLRYLASRKDSDSTQFYLLYSHKSISGRSRTTVLKVEVHNGSARRVEQIDLDPIENNFYSQDELNGKLSSFTVDKRNDTPLFNFHEGYPRLNLIESAKNAGRSLIYDIPQKITDAEEFKVVHTNQDVRIVFGQEYERPVFSFPKGSKKWLVKGYTATASEGDPPGTQRLFAIYIENEIGLPSIYFVFNNRTEHDSDQVQFQASKIENLKFTKDDFFERIIQVGNGSSRRWVIDTSKAKDRTNLVDLKATVLSKSIREDELGHQNVTERLEASEVEKRVQNLFPEIVVKSSGNGQIALSSQDGTGLGDHIFEKWPTRKLDFKNQTPFRFFETEGPEGPIEIAIIPVRGSSRAPGANLLGLIAFKDASGKRQYRAITFSTSDILRTVQDNGDVVAVRLLPFLAGSRKIELLVTLREKHVSEPKSSDDSGKTENSKAEPRDHILAWTITDAGLFQFSANKSQLDTVPRRSDIDIYLAQMESEWLWVEHGVDSFLSKGLQLKGISSGLKVEPNSSSGRLLRPKLKYLVSAEKRPTGASEARFFFNGSWKAMPHDIETTLATGIRSSPFAGKLFSEVLRQIENYLEPRSTYRPMILIIPDEIRALLGSYLSEAYQKGGPSARWSKNNNTFRHFVLPGRELNQYEIVDNLEVIANVDPSHNLLIADVKTLNLSKFPTNKDQKSLYEKTKEVRVNAAGIAQSGDLQINEEVSAAHFPHLSYLLASQGESNFSYEDTRKLKKELRFPIIAMGTREEWNAFINDPNNEFNNYGAEEWFDLVQVEAPTADAKVQLLTNIIDSPEIKTFRYRFDSTGISKKGVVLSDAEAQKSVLRHAVNRIETLSRSSDQNPFTLYLRFLGTFSESLVRDREARRTQAIGKAFIERVLTQIFNVPLNRSFLPEDDPLYILSRPDAPIKLQDAGYNGPMALKQQILEVLRSPLMPSQAKTIPSSMILAGDTGTGKSHFFQSLVKMLKLKLYDFEPQSATINEDANAIILRADKIVPSSANKSGSSSGTSTMTVEDAIAYIDHFLSLPQGYRGYIFIDDLHGAPAEVRKHLLIYLRGLFESPGGLYTTKEREIRTNNGHPMKIEAVTRPIRGLNLMAAMNFTENVELVEKFTKKGETPTLEQIILATLSTPDHNIETSFLRRWGAIVPLSSFPIEAKGPGVIEGFRKKMQSMLELQGRFSFVSTDLVTDIASRFKDTDARTFLTDTNNALYEIASTEGVAGSARIITPLTAPTNVAVLQGREISSGSSGDIARYINRNSQVLDLSNGYDGKLHLLKVVASSFRLALLERFMQGLQEHPEFSVSQAFQRQNLYPMLFAIHDYVTEYRSLPISILNLDSKKFGVTQREQKNIFNQTIARVDSFSGRGDYFPISFNDESQSGLAYRELVNSELQVPSQQTRRTVLNQYSTLLKPLFEAELAAQLRVESLVQLPSHLDPWFESLRRAEPSGEKELSRRMSELYVEFRKALYADDLAESNPNGAQRPLTAYATARLFLYVIDHAISKMAWAETIQFFARATEAAADDMVLSQSPGFHYLMHESKRSPYNLKTVDYLLSVVSNFPAFEPDFAELRGRLKSRFREDCNGILAR